MAQNIQFCRPQCTCPLMLWIHMHLRTTAPTNNTTRSCVVISFTRQPWPDMDSYCMTHIWISGCSHEDSWETWPRIKNTWNCCLHELGQFCGRHLISIRVFVYCRSRLLLPPRWSDMSCSQSSWMRLPGTPKRPITRNPMQQHAFNPSRVLF